MEKNTSLTNIDSRPSAYLCTTRPRCVLTGNRTPFTQDILGVTLGLVQCYEIYVIHLAEVRGLHAASRNWCCTILARVEQIFLSSIAIFLSIIIIIFIIISIINNIIIIKKTVACHYFASVLKKIALSLET